MDFFRSDRNNSNSSAPHNSNSFRSQFSRFDLSAITDALNSTNFNLPSSLDELLSITKTTRESKEMACDSCGHKFSLLTRKRTCVDCNMDFCNACLNKGNSSDRKNHCKRCTVLNSVPLDRNALLSLRVKDLRWYLSVKRISSQNYREKSELVDLILNSLSPQNVSSMSDSYSGQHLFSNTTSDVNINSMENQSFNANIESNSNLSENSAHSSISNQNQTSNSFGNSSEELSDNRFNIDDLTNSDQLNDLSVRQLKLILTRNFIDYRGCCEKEELLVKARRLWVDRQENKQSADDITDTNLCKICMELSIDCVLLECGHMVTCTNCGKRLNECPICRQYVVRAVHIFKA